MLLLLACTAPLTSAERVVGDVGKRSALDGYLATKDAAGELQRAVGSFCAAPDDAGLLAARDAWWAARAPWKRQEIFKFGPMVDEPLRYGPKIDDWPTHVEALEELLAGEESFDGDLGARLGSTTRGFPALEWLLWAALADFQAGRRCELTVALAGDLAGTTTGLWAAWSPTDGDYLRSLVLPEVDSGGFDDRGAVVAELVNRAAFTVEDIRNDKLGKPAGASSGGTPQPENVESPYSQRSLTDARDSLAGVRGVLLGVDGGQGLVTLIPSSRADLALAIPAALDEAEARLAAVPEPLAVAVVDSPAAVAAAMEALQALQVLLQADLAEVLGVTVQFNDNDGD